MSGCVCDIGTKISYLHFKNVFGKSKTINLTICFKVKYSVFSFPYSDQ